MKCGSDLDCSGKSMRASDRIVILGCEKVEEIYGGGVTNYCHLKYSRY